MPVAFFHLFFPFAVHHARCLYNLLSKRLLLQFLLLIPHAYSIFVPLFFFFPPFATHHCSQCFDRHTLVINMNVYTHANTNMHILNVTESEKTDVRFFNNIDLKQKKYSHSETLTWHVQVRFASTFPAFDRAGTVFAAALSRLHCWVTFVFAFLD